MSIDNFGWKPRLRLLNIIGRVCWI